MSGRNDTPTHTEITRQEAIHNAGVEIFYLMFTLEEK